MSYAADPLSPLGDAQVRAADIVLQARVCAVADTTPDGELLTGVLMWLDGGKTGQGWLLDPDQASHIGDLLQEVARRAADPAGTMIDAITAIS